FNGFRLGESLASIPVESLPTLYSGFLARRGTGSPHSQWVAAGGSAFDAHRLSPRRNRSVSSIGRPSEPGPWLFRDCLEDQAIAPGALRISGGAGRRLAVVVVTISRSRLSRRPGTCAEYGGVA